MRPGVTSLLAAVIAISAAGNAGAAALHLAGAPDLSRSATVRVDGAVAGDRAGEAATPVGDVNGDGVTDFAVGAPRTKPPGPGPDVKGSVYVIFGPLHGGAIDLASLGSRGFRIDSPDEGAQLGHAVAGAGDVNGDGLADVIVGAPEAPGAGNTAPPGFLRSGAAYVVFGKRDSQPVNLEALGSGGLAIRGTQQIERVGESVAGLGDVNGDGIADIAVAAPGHATNPGNGPAGGAAYVVFGRKGAASDIRLDALGDRGYEIDGSRRNFGSSVSAAGDVNGDGRRDLIVGAPLENDDLGPHLNTGAAYVVFGKADTASVSAGQDGFRIVGAIGARETGPETSIAGDTAGRFPMGIGDVNGDGLDDIAVDAGWDTEGEGPQRIYVVFGRRTSGQDVDLRSFAGQGFEIDAGVHGGGPMALPAGDLNGDGLDDLWIGGRLVGTSNLVIRRYPGPQRLFAIYGKRDTAPVALDDVTPASGFQVTGAPGDLDSAGDVNGDGRSDLVFGNFGASPRGRKGAGSAWVYTAPGPRPLAPSRCANPSTGTQADDFVPGTLQGDVEKGLGGNDELRGRSGSDCIDGGPGDDTIDGGTGNDRLVGGPGRDVIDGGPGNDVIDAADGERDVVRCGPGRDRAILDQFDRAHGCERVLRVHRPPLCKLPQVARAKLVPQLPKRGALVRLRITAIDGDSTVLDVTIRWGDGKRTIVRGSNQRHRVIRREVGHRYGRGRNSALIRVVAESLRAAGCRAAPGSRGSVERSPATQVDLTFRR